MERGTKRPRSSQDVNAVLVGPKVRLNKKGKKINRACSKFACIVFCDFSENRQKRWVFDGFAFSGMESALLS